MFKPNYKKCNFCKEKLVPNDGEVPFSKVSKAVSTIIEIKSTPNGHIKQYEVNACLPCMRKPENIGRYILFTSHPCNSQKFVATGEWFEEYAESSRKMYKGYKKNDKKTW